MLGSGREKGMRRWFLSYHLQDETLAARLKSAVEGKDPAASRAGRSAYRRRCA